MAFFVAATFSTITGDWQLWGIPLGWLITATIWRWRAGAWPPAWVAAWLAVGGITIPGALHGAGWCLRDPRLSVSRREIRFGTEDAPAVVIYQPNRDVLGSQWGH